MLFGVMITGIAAFALFAHRALGYRPTYHGHGARLIHVDTDDSWRILLADGYVLTAREAIDDGDAEARELGLRALELSQPQHV